MNCHSEHPPSTPCDHDECPPTQCMNTKPEPQSGGSLEPVGSEVPDLRTGPLCIECNTNRCDTIEDEICPECWNAHRDASNFTRMFRIACGWTVDNTGGIHPPNAAGELRPPRDNH